MDDQQTAGMEDSEPRTKAALVARIEAARRQLDETIQSLSAGEMEAPGPDGGWSVKDHIAHLTVWERGIAALLRREPRWEAMGLDRETVLAGDEESINHLLHRQHHARPLDEVLVAFRQGQRELSDALAPLEDADLLKTYSSYQPEEPGEDRGDPIVGWIAGNTYAHYEEHQRYIEQLLSR